MKALPALEASRNTHSNWRLDTDFLQNRRYKDAGHKSSETKQLVLSDKVNISGRLGSDAVWSGRKTHTITGLERPWGF
jgi:hypothetical protein